MASGTSQQAVFGSTRNTAVVAPFTDRTLDQDTPCERPTCQAIIPGGDKVFYVQSLDDPAIEGRWVCHHCFSHYQGVGGRYLSQSKRHIPGTLSASLRLIS